MTEDNKVLYLSELTPDDYYFDYLVDNSKIITENDTEFKVWNKHIFSKEKNYFDYWILLPTGNNRRILRLLSDYKTIKKTITKTNISTGYNHTFRIKVIDGKYKIYSSSGVDLFFSTQKDKQVLFSIFSKIINNNNWRINTNPNDFSLGNVNLLTDINLILMISYNDLLLRNERFGNNIDEQRNGISFQIYTIIKIILLYHEISNGFNYDCSHNMRLSNVIKKNYINGISNICELNSDKIYYTKLRNIKFDLESIKSQKIKEISSYLWDILFPKKGDGFLDVFHKRDIIRKCPLYSVVWQEDNYIIGHRFATIMELNGYSKEMKNLHFYQPDIFNNFILKFNLDQTILVDKNLNLDNLNNSINSDDFQS